MNIKQDGQVMAEGRAVDVEQMSDGMRSVREVLDPLDTASAMIAQREERAAAE